jgi:hypothetical protein
VGALHELGRGGLVERADLAAEGREQLAHARDGLRLAAGDHGHPRVAEVLDGRGGPQELRVGRELEARAHGLARLPLEAGRTSSSLVPGGTVERTTTVCTGAEAARARPTAAVPSVKAVRS